MSLFNISTSKVLPYSTPNMNGVVLPQSDRVLSEQDLEKKIEKTKNQISHLTNAQAHRNTHGGKRFRARKISQQDQIQHCSHRLVLLESAKAIVVKLNKTSQIHMFETAKDSKSRMLHTASAISGAQYCVEGASSNVFFAGKMRTFTVLKAVY